MNRLIQVLGGVGRKTFDGLHALLGVCRLLYETFYWIGIAPFGKKGFRFRSAVEHFVEYGVGSMPIVALITFLIGAIMAMQASYQLARFGASRYIADLVGVGALRELAPLITAILITGRSGSAITAEIGTMKVSEEIDALEVMGIHPAKFLIAPKFVAMVLAVPCVTVMAMLVPVWVKRVKFPKLSEKALKTPRKR